tara:strand:- start:281 stop:736 length:456 start_codon:yes stop_codon:yes gene_type:complete
MDNPTSLTATQTLGSIALAWTAASGATSYLIYRQDYDLGTNETFLIETTATSFVDYGPPRTTTALAAIDYQYTIKATDGSATSSGAYVDADCTLLANADVDDVGLGHPKYKISSTTYTATLSATTYGTTVNAAAGLNDVCALTLAKSLSRL